MGSYTGNLNLLKKDPTTDGNDTFNIKTMLNDNWDKIDEFCNSSKAKIAKGTYVGTGTQGSTNPNTLTFDFVPKFIYIIGRGGYKYSGLERNVQTLLVNNSTNANSFGFGAILAPSSSGSCYQAGLTVSWNDTEKTVSWYVNSGKGDDISKTMQLNFANITYHYIAVG